jgi:hypothetical protein
VSAFGAVELSSWDRDARVCKRSSSAYDTSCPVETFELMGTGRDGRRDDAPMRPTPTVARSHNNLVQNANVVRVPTMFLLVLGLAGSILTVILGFTHDAPYAVISGLGSAFVVVLTSVLLLLVANWAVAWSATTLRH